MEKIIALLPFIYLAIIATPLFIIDLREHRLPNKLVLPFLYITFTAWLALAIWKMQWENFGIALGLAFGVFVILLVLNALDMLGMGDVKLITFATLYLGWISWSYALINFGLIFGLMAFCFILVTIRKGMTINHVPMGVVVVPLFLIIATVAQVQTW